MSEKMTAEQAIDTLGKHAEEIRGLGKQVEEHERSKSELTERIDKWEGEVKKALDRLAEMQRSPLQETGASDAYVEIPKDFRMRVDGHDVCEELNDHQKANLYLRQMSAAKGSDLERYQIISDGLTLLPRFKRKKNPLFKELQGLHRKFTQKAGVAMDTTSESEWVPAEVMSANLIDRIRDAQSVAALFERVPMPNQTTKLPVLTADASAYVVSENTVYPGDTGSSAFTASQPTSANITLGAVKLAVSCVQSVEMVEEATFDTLVWLNGHVARVIAESIDRAIINGDATTVHFDTGASYNAAGPETAWHGLRYLSTQAGTAIVYDPGSNVTLTAAVIAAARGLMGKYGGFGGATGGGAACISSYKVYSDLLQDTNFATFDKYGNAAGVPVVVGEVGRVHGMPFVCSEHYPSDNMNTDGAVDGTTTSTRSSATLVNRGWFKLGDRRQVTVKTSEDRFIEYDQIITVATWRGDFEPQVTPSLATYPAVLTIVDIA